MGYKVLGKTEELFKNYGPRKGLEGPYIFGGRKILYYDPKEGRYWDPTTDFYVEHDEMGYWHNELMRMLERA
jgi:hypothetical protein